MVIAGVTTLKIDQAVRDYIVSQGAKPTFYKYNGFPGNICISVNEQVIHGIPGNRVLVDGDVVSIDVGATFDGYVGDCAATYIVGKGTKEAEKLIEVTRQSFYEGIKFAREGFRVSDISSAIQKYVEANGFTVVREYVGHGVGSALHEPPEVPNFGQPGHGARLVRGMTLAIEPMVNMGGAAIRMLNDDWTVVTADGTLSAHYENTILITDDAPEILTVSTVDNVSRGV
jgi:methionyl aminopeptidase